MISFNVNVPLSSGEGLGVRLSDGLFRTLGSILSMCLEPARNNAIHLNKRVKLIRSFCIELIGVL
jgi:hypothetical protein